ncbi:amidohydrolase family protein [Pigmentiphaga soli]|uniref:Amidohydrolase family protein n=1 Tax=Pigmentiphaga soli TaxID=1007095 RepID=A0ABP8GV17_9BURK
MTTQVPAIEPPLVDAHAHIYTLDMPMSGSAWHKPPADATIGQYLKTLDDHGVRFAVMAAASIYGDYNDYAIDACRAHPRLRTTVIVDPGIDRYVLEQMKADGVVGIRFQRRNVKTPPDLATPEYRKLLRRVADLDWHVHLHDEGARLPPAIAALEAAGVKLVIDHFGRPTAELGVNCPGFQAVLRSVERGRTWVKLSAGFRMPSDEAAARYAAELLKVGGPERLVWGSDWPFAAYESKVSYQDTIDSFARWVPDPALRRRIGGETPLALYFS